MLLMRYQSQSTEFHFQRDTNLSGKKVLRRSFEVKNIALWAYMIEDLNVDKIVGTFYEKELQKT